MTSTNDGKDVKSNQTSGHKSKTYYIELYTSLEKALSSDNSLEERTKHVCDAWRRVYTLYQHSATSTHPHLLSWLQRHTANTVLQSKWAKSKNEHTRLADAIDALVAEATAASEGRRQFPWEEVLLQRAAWFQKALENPWDNPVLKSLINPNSEPVTDQQVLEWLISEHGIVLVTRLQRMVAAGNCDDLALLLASAVMDRARAAIPHHADDSADEKVEDQDSSSFVAVLEKEASFTSDEWDLLTDIELVLLLKTGKRPQCIELAKKYTPLRYGYKIVERLRKRLETAPRDKKLWKHAKEVATIVTQVVIARCMVLTSCSGAGRDALYWCARSLARLLAPAALRSASTALAAPAATARHLHTFCAALSAECKELKTDVVMKPYICELYVRAITAGMNELEQLKLNAEKESEARLYEQTLAGWFTQLGGRLGDSVRLRAECALTAFSVHPARKHYERVLGTLPPPGRVTKQEPTPEIKSEYGSWANDSRTQSNLVKTSETLQMKQSQQHQANVLSTAILTEGEALGLEPELCQDLAVLLSGPRVKTLSWDMDREVLLENCRSYMEKTDGGTRAVTTELKFLNLDPNAYQHLPEEEDDENDVFYGIEKGYEHEVQFEEPEEIWQHAFFDPEQTESANDSDIELLGKKKSKAVSSEDEDPLSTIADAKKEKKKRAKEKEQKKKKDKQDDSKDGGKERRKDKDKNKKPKMERKIKTEQPTVGSLTNLLGMKVAKVSSPVQDGEKRVRKKKERRRDSTFNYVNVNENYDSQGKSQIDDPNVLVDGVFSMDDMKSPERLVETQKPIDNTKKIKSEIQSPVIPYIKPRPTSSSTVSTSSDSDVARAKSPYFTPNQLAHRHVVNPTVKSSLHKLLQFRRNQNKMRAVARPPQAQTPSGPLIGMKIYNPDDVPKVYLNKKQSKQLETLSNEVNSLIKDVGTDPIPKTHYNEAEEKLQRQKILYNAQKYGHAQQYNSMSQNVLNESLKLQTMRQSPNISQTNYASPAKSDVRPYGLSHIPKPIITYPSFHKSMQNLSADKLDLPKKPLLLNNPSYLNQYIKSNASQLSPKIMSSTIIKPPSQTVTSKDEFTKSQTLSNLHRTYTKPAQNSQMTNLKGDVIRYEQKQLSSSMHNITEVPASSYDATRRHIPTPSDMLHRQASRTKSFNVISHSDALNSTQALQSNSTQVSGSFQNRETVDTTPQKPDNNDFDEILLEFVKSMHSGSGADKNPTVALNKDVKLTCVPTSKPAKQTDLVTPSAKQPLQQKKSENAPNTFSRLSYMHKNKQNENKLQLTDAVTLELNKKIKEHKISKAKYIKNEVTISRVGMTNPNTQKVEKIKKIEQAASPLQRNCPVLSSMLEHSGTPNMQTYNNVPVISHSSSESQPNREDADLLLLLRNQTILKPNQNKTQILTSDASPHQALTITPHTKVETQSLTRQNLVGIKVKNLDILDTCSTKESEDDEWKRVMDAIRAQKTEPLGPNALDLVLKKNQRPSQGCARTSGKRANVTGQSSSQNKPTDTKKRYSQSSRTNSTTRKPSTEKHSQLPKKPRDSETMKKVLPEMLPRTDVQIKHSSKMTKEVSHTTVIPNSDYDILDDLIDDDLRRELGEISSDEEAYSHNAPLIKVKNQRNIPKPNSIVCKAGNMSKEKPRTDNQTHSNTVHDVRSAINTSVYPNMIINNSSQPSATHKENRPTTDINTMQQYAPSSSIITNQVAQSTANNIITHIEANQYVNNILPANVIIASVPQPTPVVVIRQELLYDPYPTIRIHESQVNAELCAINQNVFAVNSGPNIAVYQTTQFAAPVINPIIIGNATTTTNVSNATAMENEHVTPDYPKETLNTPDNDSISLETALKLSDALSETPETPNLDFNMNRHCERKVLSQMHENHTNEIDKESNLCRLPQDDVPLKTKQNEERIKQKRQSLINRKIIHDDDHPPIPLTYTPLNKKLVPQELQKNGAIKPNLRLMHTTNDDEVVTASLKSPTSETNNENIESTNQTTGAKENKKSCRRIWLRSSNKITDKKVSPVKRPIPLKRNIIKLPIIGNINKDVTITKIINKNKNRIKIMKRTSTRLLNKKRNINKTSSPTKMQLDIIENNELIDFEKELESSIVVKSTAEMLVAQENKLGDQLVIKSTTEKTSVKRVTTVSESQKFTKPSNKNVTEDCPVVNQSNATSFETNLNAIPKAVTEVPLLIDETNTSQPTKIVDRKDNITTEAGSSHLVDKSNKLNLTVVDDHQVIKDTTTASSSPKDIKVVQEPVTIAESLSKTVQKPVSDSPEMKDEIQKIPSQTPVIIPSTDKPKEGTTVVKSNMSVISVIADTTIPTNVENKINNETCPDPPVQLSPQEYPNVNMNPLTVSEDDDVEIIETSETDGSTKTKDANTKLEQSNLLDETPTRVQQKQIDTSKLHLNLEKKDEVLNDDSVAKQNVETEKQDGQKCTEHQPSDQVQSLSAQPEALNNNLAVTETPEVEIINASVNNAKRTNISDTKPKENPTTYMKGDIKIEEVPLDDPNKQLVRILLPNGKVFKATIYGKIQGDFDSLFAQPSMRAILASNTKHDGIRYIMNYKQKQTTFKDDPTRKVEQIQDLNFDIKRAGAEPVDTVNLISDDEDELPTQTKTTFNTEFGKYSTNLDQEVITIHQKKFDQICEVKLCREDLFKSNRTKPKQKSLPSEKSSLLTRNKLKLLSATPLTMSIVPKDETDCNADKLTHVPSPSLNQVNTPLEPKTADVIEIDDSSNDSIDTQTPESDDNRKLEPVKITALTNLLLQDLGIETDKIIPPSHPVKSVAAVVNLKSSLLQDLGIVPAQTPLIDITENDDEYVNNATDVRKPTDNLKEDKSVIAAPNAEEDKTTKIQEQFNLKKCVVKIVKCDKLIKKYELRRQMQHCFVKMERLSNSILQRAMSENISDGETDEMSQDNAEDFIEFHVDETSSSPQLSRCPSLSILNIWDDDSQPSLDNRSSTSPVMEIYDTLVKLRNKLQTQLVRESEKLFTSTCDSDWTRTKLACSTQEMLLRLSRVPATKNTSTCDSDWTRTKLACSTQEMLLRLSRVPATKNQKLLPVFDNNAEKTIKKIHTPKLLTITLKFLEDNPNLLYQLELPRSKEGNLTMTPLPNRLKRKTKEVVSEIVASKVLKLGTLALHTLNASFRTPIELNKVETDATKPDPVTNIEKCNPIIIETLCETEIVENIIHGKKTDKTSKTVQNEDNYEESNPEESMMIVGSKSLAYNEESCWEKTQDNTEIEMSVLAHDQSDVAKEMGKINMQESTNTPEKDFLEGDRELSSPSLLTDYIETLDEGNHMIKKFVDEEPITDNLPNSKVTEGNQAITSPLALSDYQEKQMSADVISKQSANDNSLHSMDEKSVKCLPDVAEDNEKVNSPPRLGNHNDISDENTQMCTSISTLEADNDDLSPLKEVENTFACEPREIESFDKNITKNNLEVICSPALHDDSETSKLDTVNLIINHKEALNDLSTEVVVEHTASFSETDCIDKDVTTISQQINSPASVCDMKITIGNAASNNLSQVTAAWSCASSSRETNDKYIPDDSQDGLSPPPLSNNTESDDEEKHMVININEDSANDSSHLEEVEIWSSRSKTDVFNNDFTDDSQHELSPPPLSDNSDIEKEDQLFSNEHTVNDKSRSKDNIMACQSSNTECNKKDVTGAEVKQMSGNNQEPVTEKSHIACNNPLDLMTIFDLPTEICEVVVIATDVQDDIDILASANDNSLHSMDEKSVKYLPDVAEDNEKVNSPPRLGNHNDISDENTQMCTSISTLEADNDDLSPLKEVENTFACEPREIESFDKNITKNDLEVICSPALHDDSETSKLDTVNLIINHKEALNDLLTEVVVEHTASFSETDCIDEDVTTISQQINSPASVCDMKITIGNAASNNLSQVTAAWSCASSSRETNDKYIPDDSQDGLSPPPLSSNTESDDEEKHMVININEDSANDSSHLEEVEIGSSRSKTDVFNNDFTDDSQHELSPPPLSDNSDIEKEDQFFSNEHTVNDKSRSKDNIMACQSSNTECNKKDVTGAEVKQMSGNNQEPVTEKSHIACNNPLDEMTIFDLPTEICEVVVIATDLQDDIDILASANDNSLHSMDEKSVKCLPDVAEDNEKVNSPPRLGNHNDISDENTQMCTSISTLEADNDDLSPLKEVENTFACEPREIESFDKNITKNDLEVICSPALHDDSETSKLDTVNLIINHKEALNDLSTEVVVEHTASFSETDCIDEDVTTISQQINSPASVCDMKTTIGNAASNNLSQVTAAWSCASSSRETNNKYIPDDSQDGLSPPPLSSNTESDDEEKHMVININEDSANDSSHLEEVEIGSSRSKTDVFNNEFTDDSQHELSPPPLSDNSDIEKEDQLFSNEHTLNDKSRSKDNIMACQSSNTECNKKDVTGAEVKQMSGNNQEPVTEKSHIACNNPLDEMTIFDLPTEICEVVVISTDVQDDIDILASLVETSQEIISMPTEYASEIKNRISEIKSPDFVDSKKIAFNYHDYTKLQKKREITTKSVSSSTESTINIRADELAKDNDFNAECLSSKQQYPLKSKPECKYELIQEDDLLTVNITTGCDKDNRAKTVFVGPNVVEDTVVASPCYNNTDDIKGYEFEDVYVFPLSQASSSTSNISNDSLTPDLNSESVSIRVTNDLHDIDFHVKEPEITYSRKRKMSMRDVKVTEKKYRKGKNIDCSKQTQFGMVELAYSKEYKRLLEYCSSVKFSYSRPFHKECVELENLLDNWPINSVCCDVLLDEADEHLFVDLEQYGSYQPDPTTQTFIEEISYEYNRTDAAQEDPLIEASETNFNMGFGEESGRVIQILKTGGESNISAATLSDVKQSQPVFKSVDPDYNDVTTNNHDLVKKIRQHVNFIELRDKVRQFFKKTSVELKFDWMQQNTKEELHPEDFLFGLCSLDYVKPLPTNAIVQVVQVGQLPVSAAAQNPVTCDPRVTQVSNASPSQCSVDNSPNDDSQSEIKTEYTELTTADLTLPLQEYAQQNQASLAQENNVELTEQTISLEMEIKEEESPEIKQELPDIKEEKSNSSDTELHTPTNATPENMDYTFENNTAKDMSSINYDASEQNSTETFSQQRQQNGTTEKTDQIAHAMNAAGITTTPDTVTNTRAHALVNILSQKLRQGSANAMQTTTNTYSKASINAMALQQALAQILPPPLNQTGSSENNQTQSGPVGPQVLHIVQGKNASGNQITLVDNSQQSVISTPNATQVLHIVQNKSATSSQASNGTLTPQANSFSGLSLVDAGLQQGGNQLLHIVNTGNQKNASPGQLLKRVNLLTNLTNVQGSNEQKMVQFVCKSADGKAIQLNAPHQRSMVLRLQPIETPNVQTPPTKSADSQELSPSPTGSASSKESASQQEIKSRSIYEENYAKFIQNSSSKMPGLEKATSLPKFNQAFGKPVFQEGSQKQGEAPTNNSHLPPVNTNSENAECPANDNAINLEHMGNISSPPLLIRKPVVTSQSQSSIVQQIKQTIAPMNIQTMHGGVIYTRQIPVNIGGGQTINLITVPSTELINDDASKTQAQNNQGEIEPSIIKIVPQGQTTTNTDGSQEENNHASGSNDIAQAPQPQPVLTQMRIKLPMLSKAPQMVPGARVVRPSFFQIQRNVIGGANQPVYQQLVLTAAPPLGQQTIRLPSQASRPVKVPSESQSSSSESQMSSSTLEQLREFDMVLEQVKERSTSTPSANSNNSSFKIHTSSSDTTDGNASSNCSTESTSQVLYSIGNNQSLNVAFVNRKSSVTTPTTSTYVRSPDSSGIADSPTSSTHVQIPHTVTTDSSSTEMSSQSKPAKVGSKSKSRPKSTSNPPNTLKLSSSVPPKTSSQKPLEDEQTTQRILYILAEYKEQVENSPDKDKPAPRRRSNPPSNPGSSKRKKSSSSRRSGTRDMSPVHGEDTCRTMGSEDSSCGTSQGDCNESCLDSHSPQDSPRKVARKITFDQDLTVTQPRPQPQRNVIVADGQTITVARGSTGKPATAVLMPANYILPVSMVKGGQQIAIVTNRGPKLLTVGGDGGATNALLLQRLIGPAGLKPVLTRPGVRHVRLPTAALHNLQAFNLATATTVQPPDSTASPTPGPTPPELVDTRATSSPWTDREDVKPERSSSPEGSEPWNLPTDAHEYTYEETVRTDNMDRTVLDQIPDRYSPDMEAQRIFDKMFDVDSKKSYTVDSHDDSPRCAYDIDPSDCDDKAYQVVQKKDGSQRQHRLAHVSAAALRHKYAILEHELRLQKSLSEECEDLGVDSPSASELFPEAELLFANSPAHEHNQEHHSHTPQPLQSSIPQPDMDDQIATDHLIPREIDVSLGLGDVGIVAVSEDGSATIALDQEEFARSHPNTTFHSEPTDGEVQPFTITGLKGRHITSTIFHSNSAPATVLMTAPQATVISQAPEHSVKYEIENMINAMPSSHNNDINLSSVLVKDDGLTRFDSILTDSRELHLTNTASAIVHSSGNATQVIRRVCYEDDKRERDARYLIDEPDNLIAGDDAKMIAEDSSRDATLESMADVDDDRSSPERHAELFWESNSASERSESRRPLDFSSDSDKCCKSPSFDETNSTDSSGVGTHMRLDSVIKEARGRDSADGSSADDAHPPLRTYPAKRMHHPHPHPHPHSESGKTRAGERSPDAEVRRRASARGVVKRGCHCCNGDPAPPRPKKPRQRKPTLDFNTNN